MSKRRRFTADFKAKVVLEALRGDRTIQEIAAKHKVHPNQVSTWKRQAMDGLDAVFSNGTDKARVDHAAEIHDLYAKIMRPVSGRAALRPSNTTGVYWLR